MGDEGTIEITLGNNSAKAMLFPRKQTQRCSHQQSKSGRHQGAELVGWGDGGQPWSPQRDSHLPGSSKAGRRVRRQGNGFCQEMAHRYGHYGNGQGTGCSHRGRGSFFACIREGKKPIADVHVGAADSRAVIFANRAMETNQRVFWPKETAAPPADPDQQEDVIALKAHSSVRFDSSRMDGLTRTK